MNPEPDSRKPKSSVMRSIFRCWRWRWQSKPSATLGSKLRFYRVSVGIRLSGLGFGYRDWGLGIRVKGLGFKVRSLGLLRVPVRALQQVP